MFCNKTRKKKRKPSFKPRKDKNVNVIDEKSLLCPMKYVEVN